MVLAKGAIVRVQKGLDVPDFSKIKIRRLEPEEWQLAFSIIGQLRKNLDAEAYLSGIEEQSRSGYELVGAFNGEKIIGAMGMWPMRALAHGAYLYIDDLVVGETHRRHGVGRALMNFAEDEARSRGMSRVSLNARPEAIAFYEAIGYAFHTSPAMRKIF